MKKRLFISSILMTLVLLVAITTATFAWYQASQTGTASVNGFTPQTVETQKGSVYEYSNGNVTITLVAREVADTELVPATWVAAVGKPETQGYVAAHWGVKYVKADGTLIDESDMVTQTHSGTVVRSKAYAIYAYANRELSSDDLASIALVDGNSDGNPDGQNTLNVAISFSESTDTRILWSTSQEALADGNAMTGSQADLKLTLATSMKHFASAPSFADAANTPTLVGYVLVAYEGNTAEVTTGHYAADENAPSITLVLTGSFVHVE